VSDVVIGAAPPSLRFAASAHLLGAAGEARVCARFGWQRSPKADFVAATSRLRARRLNRILPLVESHAEEFRALSMSGLSNAAREVATALRQTP